MNEIENLENKVENAPEESQENKISIDFSIQDMIDANWYFGGPTKKQNHMMKQYIYESKFGNDVINLIAAKHIFQKTLEKVVACTSKGGRVLFVGTEKGSSDIVQGAAYQSGQYHVSKRWIGGLLTNWQSFNNLTNNVRRIEQDMENNNLGDLTKQEKNRLTKKREVFERFLGGVKDMGHLPNLIVLRSDREINPIKEAKMLSIPTIALVDTTSNPTNITYPVPGNNKSLSTVEMYFNLISRACLLGLQHLSVQPKAPEPVERNRHEGGSRPYRFGRQHFTPRAYVKSHHERQDEQVPIKE